MVSNQSAFLILSSVALETAESNGRVTKRQDFRKKFSFPNVTNFWKFINQLWYQLKKLFFINYQYSWSYATFLLRL